jgi:hypothetical protein
MVSRIHHLAMLALWMSTALACGKGEQPRTQLVLVADTDIPDLDLIRFEVSNGQRMETEESAPRDDGEPFTLTLLLDKGPLGPLAVSAQGVRNGQMVVERRAVVSFVPGKTLVVELHLLASCVARLCLGDRTCGEHGCTSNELSSDQLSEWSGSPPRVGGTLLSDAGETSDGGVHEAGAGSDAAADASAEAGDASTNGLVTCGVDTQVDLSSDVDHCGSCGTSCKASGRNLVAVCVAGECAEECRTLYGDCDENPNNGCEQSLSVSANCGMCGVSCAAGDYCLFGFCL